MDLKQHAVAAAVGAVVAGGALTLDRVASPTPSLAARHHVGETWPGLDVKKLSSALMDLQITYAEIVCSSPNCADAAADLVDAFAINGVDAQITAPIGRLPRGLTVIGHLPLAKDVATALYANADLPATFLGNAAYGAGLVTIAFGPLQ